MRQVKYLIICEVLIFGLFINLFAEDFLLSSKVRINEQDNQLAPLPAIAVETTLVRLPRQATNLIVRQLPDPTVDTLRNHDRLPSFYYTRDSVYYATRLTMPTAASPCSIKVIRFGLYRPRSSSSMLCSLFVWRDTIINGVHQPGIALHHQLYVISSWQVGYWSWNYVTLSTPIVLQPNEDFWLGFFGLASDVNQLSDGSENLDSTRNEIRLAGGVWQSNQYDFLQEAVVSYLPVDSNVGITKISGVGKIVIGSSLVTITATVKNFGRTTLPAGIPITLKIVGPSVVYETTANTQTSIYPNNTIDVTFAPWQFPNISGDYEIKVWTAFAEDPIHTNDTMSTNSFVYTRGYLETFMSDFPPPGWIIFNFNGNNQWSKTNSVYFADEGSARILWDPGPQAPNNDWLITPRFKAYANDSLIFWYRAASSEFYETLLVRVDTILNGLDTINFSIIIDTVITNSTDWQHRIIPFNRILIDSASVYVAFHYPCDNNFYIAIDDVILPRIDTVYDFFPVSFNTPKLPIIVDSTYQVSAIFRNNSVTQEVLSLYVFYQIVGENIFYKESVWVGIGGGNNEDVEFANFLPTVSETVAIKIWTAYPDDENKHNDTLFKKVFIAPKFYAPPYEKDFNEDWGVYGDNPPLGGWRIIQGGNRDTIWNTNDWYRDTIRIGNNVRQVAMVYYSPLENQFERLISPRIDCSSPGLYNLHYWHWYQNYDPSLRDSGVVLISTNGGFTWPVRVARYFNTNDSGYKTINITSSVVGQSNVRICFLYGGYNEYWWAIDDFSIEWIPFGPVLLSPANGFETYNRTIQFAWQPINNVSSYLIEIAYDSLFQAPVISETVNVDTISLTFEPETYYWRVKAVQPIGQYSETRKFKILLMPVGWVKYPNIPLLPSGKSVKNGGAVCFCPIDSCIYVLKGNNTRDFYARHYFLGNYDWITKPSIPLDTAKRRNVKEGSAICFGESLIYVIKGKTNEFYAYNPKTDSWIRKRDVPVTKGLKDGTSITFVPPMSKDNCHLFNSKNLGLNTKKDQQESGYIYLLKGSSKECEFLAYSIANDSWEIRARAPAGPNNKKFKAGSSIVYSEQDNKIYALKGGSKYNEFYFYDITADTWSHFPGDTLPCGLNNRKVKNGGALTYCDGKIYAIKGGGRNEFWCYSESLGEKRWRMLDSIPKYTGLPKAGASLTAGAGIVYLLKGNNTTECWAYFPRSEDKLISQEFQSNKSSVTANISSQPVKSNYRFNIEVHPNPAKDFINICYSINEPMPLTVKLYDITGQVLAIIKDANIIRPGIYQQKLPIANLANGIYFISLENYQKKVIAKFIVQ